MKIKSRMLMAGVAGVAAALAIGAGAVASRSAKAQAEATKAPATPITENIPSAAGAVAFKDPQTGQLRAPEPSEIAALVNRDKEKKGAQRERPQSVPYALPGGGVALDADSSMDVSMVAVKTPDGKVKEACLAGQPTAEALAKVQQSPAEKETLDEK